jgi:hypothetical protein
LYWDIRELVTLGALDDVVQDEDHAIVGRFEDEDILVLALLVVKNLLDLEGHGLTGPHVGDLAEPAILKHGISQVVCIAIKSSLSSYYRKNIGALTFDGGMLNGRHFAD